MSEKSANILQEEHWHQSSAPLLIHGRTHTHTSWINPPVSPGLRQRRFPRPCNWREKSVACFIVVQLLSGGLFTCSQVGARKAKMWAVGILASLFFFFLPCFISVRPCLCIIPLLFAYSARCGGGIVFFSCIFCLIGHMSVSAWPRALISQSVRPPPPHWWSRLNDLRCHLNARLFLPVHPVLWEHLQRSGSDGGVGLLRRV